MLPFSKVTFFWNILFTFLSFSTPIKYRLNRLTLEENKVKRGTLLMDMSRGNVTAKAYISRLHPGQGVHTMDISVGGQQRTLILDTGSGQLAFPCQNCLHCSRSHKSPPYAMTSTARQISCVENDSFGFKKCSQCSTVHGVSKTKSVCSYEQKYIEGSFWKAIKTEDVMSFPDEHLESTRIYFGCIYEERGEFENQYADGIVGLARENDALHMQLYRLGTIPSPTFSLCLANQGGHLVFGGEDPSINQNTMAFTPLRETKYKYWNVYLETVRIGDQIVNVGSEIYNKGRGAIFDSGTSYAYFPSEVEIPFQEAWLKSTQHLKNDNAREYTSGKVYKLSKSELENLPHVTFKFLNDVHMHIAPTQYMQHVGYDKYEATFMFASFTQATILGASVMENHNIYHDMGNNRIGIAKADCDSAKGVTLVTDVEGDVFTRDSGFNYGLLFLGMISSFVIVEGARGIYSWMKTPTTNVDNSDLYYESII